MTHSILVADDEPNIALSLKFLMEQAGFSVQTASDGQQALDLIADSAPDLILLYINMPKVNGYQVCEAVRAKPDWNHVRGKGP